MKNLKTLTTVFVSASMLAGSVYAQENPKLSDPEVAHVAVAANQIDIAYAAIAKEKSKDADILKFAETMTNDHNAVINQASALVKKLNVTPKENSVSQKLLADAEVTKKLASYGALFAIPTAIAGIYGMNFKFMPELNWHYGYPFVVGCTIFACVLLYYFFRRSGWL